MRLLGLLISCKSKSGFSSEGSKIIQLDMPLEFYLLPISRINCQIYSAPHFTPLFKYSHSPIISIIIFTLPIPQFCFTHSIRHSLILLFFGQILSKPSQIESSTNILFSPNPIILRSLSTYYLSHFQVHSLSPISILPFLHDP